MYKVLNLVNLKFFGDLFYIFTFGFLFFDSFGNYSSSIKYFHIDSRYIYNLFMLLQIAVSLINANLLSQKIIKFNNKFMFPITTIIFISLALLNGFTYQFFVFNTFYMSLENFKYVPYLAGVVLLCNLKANWLKTFPQRLFFLGGILVLIFFNFLSILNPEVFKNIIREDGLLENLQTILYFFGSIFAFLTAIKLLINRKKFIGFFFTCLAFLMFFIAGEEISWGQRIFNLQTPQDLENINLQHEITIHNIGIFQSKIDYIFMIIGLIGAFSGLIARRYIPNFYKKNYLIFPPAILLFYFFAVVRYYFLNQFVVFSYQLFTFERIGLGDRQEISETLLAIGFFSFAVFSYNLIPKFLKSKT